MYMGNLPIPVRQGLFSNSGLEQLGSSGVVGEQLSGGRGWNGLGFGSGCGNWTPVAVFQFGRKETMSVGGLYLSMLWLLACT